MGIRAIILVSVAMFFCVAAPVRAKADHFRPLTYFSPAEIVANGVAIAGNMYLATMNNPSPAFGPPDENSLDYKIWEDHRNVAHGRYDDLSDVFLSVTFGAPLVTYAVGMVSDRIGVDDAAVRMLAFLEAWNFSQMFTASAKKLVGRERPNGGDTESFFSGHTSAAFMAASFFSWDGSIWLRGIVKDDAWVGWRAGARILPFAALYTAAGLTGYYRIAAEKHWFSDVAVGAIVGAGCGNFFYILHFNPDGSVKTRSKSNKQVMIYPIIAPHSSGLMLTMEF